MFFGAMDRKQWIITGVEAVRWGWLDVAYEATLKRGIRFGLHRLKIEEKSGSKVRSIILEIWTVNQKTWKSRGKKSLIKAPSCTMIVIILLNFLSIFLTCLVLHTINMYRHICNFCLFFLTVSSAFYNLYNIFTLYPKHPPHFSISVRIHPTIPFCWQFSSW